MSKAREEFRAKLEKQLEVDRENVRRLKRRDLWDKILIASSLPLFAAYGQRASPFSVNNLTLTLSLLIFLAGDHVVEALFGAGGAKTRCTPWTTRMRGRISHRWAISSPPGGCSTIGSTNGS